MSDMPPTPAELNAITKRNSLESALLDLPAEIRLLIWDYATSSLSEELTKLKARLMAQWLDVSPANQPRFRLTSGLASGVCRQIRDETLHLEFKKKIFHFQEHYDYERFVKRVSREVLEAIRYISVGPGFRDYMEDEGSFDWNDESDESDEDDESDKGDKVERKTRYFTGLEKIFVSQGVYTRDWTVEWMSSMVSEIKGGRDTGVEVVIMDVLDENADMGIVKKMLL